MGASTPPNGAEPCLRGFTGKSADCFGTFVRTQSSAEHCFDNEERFEIPGCYDQHCQNSDEPLEAFDPRIIAVHVNNDTYAAFMNGQRLFTERRIFEEERRRVAEER